MPRVSKAKQNLRAQAALARSSRNSTQQNISQPSAASISRFSTPLSTPAVSPAPSDKPNGLLGEEIDGEQETFEIVDLPIPDVHGDPSSEFLEDEDGYHTDDDLSELEDNELEKSLERQREGEREIGQDAFHTLMRDVGQKEWKKAESNRRMGYGSKSSERTEHWRRQRAREKKAKAAEVQKSKSAHMMRSFFKSTTSKDFDPDSSEDEDSGKTFPSNLDGVTEPEANKAMEYESDTSNDELIDCEGDEDGRWGDDWPEEGGSNSFAGNEENPSQPQRKRQKLNIPVLLARRTACENKRKILEGALKDIEKHIRSRRTAFVGGSHGLQSYRAQVIESYLRLVVRKNYKGIPASETAAEAFGFAKKWGGRQVRRWVRLWLNNRDLLESERGCHVKVRSLLEDPAVKAELRTYVHSNKWAVNPVKLREFTNQTMLPAEAAKYCQTICEKEIPQGLKKYLELELFPRIHMKVGKGVSLSTACRWLQREGFKFTLHKKAIYYNGHDRPDVVKDRQERFLPAMAEYKQRLVEYEMKDLTKEIPKPLPAGVRKLVLLAHDESTCMANDGPKASWVLEGEQPILKKGVSRGSHRSDVICSTFGWLKNAGVQIEYGKNHDGFWTGELFIKQLKDKIIPEFERLHGPDYQALIMVDNSQGHGIYAPDALLTRDMNFNPAGSQPKLRDGWFINGLGERVVQHMVFPADHATFPNKPKGMKHILIERGLFRTKLKMQCKKPNCDPDATDCCAKRIIDLQPDFKEQKSLVHETIEAAGHLCIMLPKYHCELNFIKFFWGAMKRYLREHCDYTYSGLQKNIPDAMASVDVLTIRKWEHRMIRWMSAYRDGNGTKEAQIQVKKFGSSKQTSHRRVPETVACAFD